MGCCGGRDKLDNPLENSIHNSEFDTPEPEKDLIDISAARIPSLKTSAESKIESKPPDLNISSYNLLDVSNLDNNNNINQSVNLSINVGDNLDQSQLNDGSFLGELDDEMSRTDVSKSILKSSLDNSAINNTFSMNKDHLTFYFSIKRLQIFEREFLLNMYPELNLVLILDIDDSKVNQKKVFFMRVKTSSTKILSFEPIPEKGEENLKFTLQTKKPKDNANIKKISFCFYSYTLHKLLGICNDEIYFEVNEENAFKQYQINREYFMKNTGKKIGELILDMSFCETTKEEDGNQMVQLFKTNNIKIEKYEEFPLNGFKYYSINNVFFSKENEDNDKEINHEELFKEINKTKSWDEMEEKLKNSHDKFSLYILLGRLYKILIHFSKNEKIIENKIFITFSKILLTNLSYLSNTYKDKNDKLLTPLLFRNLKELLFNSKVLTNKNLENDPAKPENQINCDIITQIFFSSFEILFSKNAKSSDIHLSALNFLSKFFSDNSYCISVNNKIQNGSEYYFKLFISKKLHLKLIPIINKYFEYQACIQPVFLLFSKMLKNKALAKVNEELIKDLTTDQILDIFKKIFKIHECNNHIMTYTLQIILSSSSQISNNKFLPLIQIQKLKECFSIFRRNGFESIHDVIIQYIKMLIQKKSDGLKIEEYEEILYIFAQSLNLLKMKMKSLESNSSNKNSNNLRVHKYLCPCLSYIYSFCNILNNSPFRKENKFLKVFQDRKILDLSIELITQINSTKIFEILDTFYHGQALDKSLINEKILIFRSMFHYLSLVKNVIITQKNCLSSKSAKDLLSFINELEKNQNLNPISLQNVIEKINKENDIMNLIKVYKEYYSKFKARKEEIEKDIKKN